MIHIPDIANQIRDKRWFAEKDAVIDEITAEDNFMLEADGDRILCLILKLCLQKSNHEKFIKRYFMPLMISSENIKDAEHLPAFQKAILYQYGKAGTVSTENGGLVRFQLFLPISHFSFLHSQPLAMQFPSSNVLTVIRTDTHNIVSKTYKDMRGNCGIEGRIWLPNPETKRYEALVKAGYPNIPKIYGAAKYCSPNGEKMPLNLIMEAVHSKARVGEIFAESLNRLSNSPADYIRHILEIRLFAIETAKTVAQMHRCFLSSKKAEFQAVQASDEDIMRWSEKIRNNYEQAIAALKDRSGKRQSEKILQDMTNRLDKKKFFLCFTEGLMKAQVHGDLHGDQGLIEDSVIYWLDFEGPPAKEYVSADYDSRENLLTDLAGMIQSFRYMVHTKLYELSGLNCQNPEDHEKQRSISMIFAGKSDAEIPGLNRELIYVLKLWLNDITNYFTESYFDEAEKLNIQYAIMKQWDRKTAKSLVSLWVSARAIHELRYETYGRDWGWEAIPSSRIFIEDLLDQPFSIAA